MVQFKIPPHTMLVDGQFISVEGPDGLVSGFAYDAETNSLYAKESQIIIPPFHGLTHIAEDPIPVATTDLPGLESASDKAKLDALTQTRLGVLGFQGSGFPDDGGFMQGDIILAAGSEFIQLERIGNVVRFTVDAPIPLNCGCEECAQIFWIQDESDKTSIRPPSCSGKLPGVNAYGELKVFLLPQSAIVNPSNPTATLNLKGSYPGLIFRRFVNGRTPGQGEFELILARNNNGTSRVGWAMTPGTLGEAVSAWFMGLDTDGSQIRFDLKIGQDPGLLGSILYKGHTLTRQMAVITNYTPTILATNQYTCKFWSINGQKPIGNEFAATNVWRYNNAGNSPTALLNPQTLVLDATTDLLPIGTLVQIWEFKIGEVNGQRLVQRFFNLQPRLNPLTLWSMSGVIRFGDLLTALGELDPVSRPTELTSHDVGVSDIRLIERSVWGITGFEDKLLLSDDGQTPPSNTVLYSDTVKSIQVHPLFNPSNPTDAGDPRPNFVITGVTASTGPTYTWTENQFANGQIVFTNGALINQVFLIIENSHSTLTLFDPDGKGGQVLPSNAFNILPAPTGTSEPSGQTINNQYVAEIDPARPGLKVLETPPKSDVERPVFLWNRANHKNVYMKALVGRPSSSRFPPIDVLLQAPIDSIDDVYLKIVRRGTFTTGNFAGSEYIVVKGADWHDLPPFGSVRIMTGYFRNEVWKYFYKAAFDGLDDNATVLIGQLARFPFDSDVVADAEGTGGPFPNQTEISPTPASVPNKTTVVQVLHQDYSTSALRIEFSVNDNSSAESLQMQFKGGMLDIGTSYELNLSGDESEDFVRGMRPGSFAVSRVYTQQGFISTGTETPAVSPTGFRVVDGGFVPQPVNGDNELWNTLEIMYRDGQLWVWWNNLLIPPDTAASAALPSPVAVNTPYFPVPPITKVGKVGLRLWPGAVLRELEIRDQLFQYNEFNHGQLQLTVQ